MLLGFIVWDEVDPATKRKRSGVGRVLRMDHAGQRYTEGEFAVVEELGPPDRAVGGGLDALGEADAGRD